jgi:hypothetical protein
MEPESDRGRVGLCADCRHRRRIESRKGSTFFFCRRSEADPRYPRYPRLPVLQCPGFEAETETQ